MALRKLQGEIDRTLKRVKEGCDEFDAILLKVKEAPTANQKEKFEAELKKEIKKLQRLRDQIKSWAGSNEVKQKAPLLEARRIIETKMEAFKETERASKMKAYSTEGLSMLDDDDDGKEEARRMIDEWMGQLKAQLEAFEAELELVPIKKRASDPRCLELDYSIERHRFHVEMLERILRNIENEKIDPATIEQVKDDLEYYIESNQQQDFYEDDAMYDCLNLPEEDIAAAEKAAAEAAQELIATDSEGKEKRDDRTSVDSEDEDESGEIPRPSEGKLAPGSLIQPGSAGPTPVAQPLLPKADVARPKKETAVPKPVAPKSGLTMAQLLGGGKAPAPKEPTKAAPAQPKESTAAPPIGAAAVAVPKQPTRTLAEMLRTSVDRDQQPPGPKPAEPKVPTSNGTTSAAAAAPKKAEPKAAPKVDPRAAREREEREERERLEREDRERLTLREREEAAARERQERERLQRAVPRKEESFSSDISVPEGQRSDQMLGELPFDDELTSSPDTLVQDTRQVPPHGPDAGLAAQLPSRAAPSTAPLRYLETAMHNMPEPARPLPGMMNAGYTPLHPVPTPPHYPQVPAVGFDRAAVYRSMEPDTLFFMFYYQQRTFRQLLAARELKRQSWRFHTHHLSWFQRHDEPSEITADYERGNFIFFDFEEGWCRRVKQDFTFEYKFLESDA